MLAYYGHALSPNQTETAEGYLVCQNVPIARTGEQVYLARELGLDGDPDRPVQVVRRPEDVFSEEAMASFEGKPVTDSHPPESVGPENYGAYARGHLHNVRRQGKFLLADLYITDPGLASDIRHKVKREVSCGYTCNYEPEGSGYRQTHIRGNHAAVVPKGRAGREVAIKDTAPEAGKGKSMSKFVKNILTVFGRAAKDAAPEELGELVDTAAVALEAEGQPPAPAPSPALAADALSQKLDQVIELLTRPAQDQEPPKEETKEELAGEADLEKLEKDMEKEKEGAPAGDKAACSPEVRDAALGIIKLVRPAVAGISNKQERARVTDALIAAVKEPDKLDGILHAVQDSARAPLKLAFREVCQRQEAAYAARNPHTLQKEEK